MENACQDHQALDQTVRHRKINLLGLLKDPSKPCLRGMKATAGLLRNNPWCYNKQKKNSSPTAPEECGADNKLELISLTSTVGTEAAVVIGA